MRITVLGSAEAFSSGGRGNSAYLVDDAHGRLLIDCGPTVPFALRARGFDPKTVTHLAITHLHGDHIAGLPFLILSGIYEHPDRPPLVVAGPRLLERQTE